MGKTFRGYADDTTSRRSDPTRTAQARLATLERRNARTTKRAAQLAPIGRA